MISKRCKNTGEIPSENRKWKAFIFHLFPRSSYTRTISLKLYTFFLPSSSSSTLHSRERKGKGRFASTHSLQSRVIRVPRDHRNPQVTGQLQKVLGAGRAPPVLLVVHQVQDGRHVFRQEVVAQRFQDLWNTRAPSFWNENLQYSRCFVHEFACCRNINDENSQFKDTRLNKIIG